MSAIRIARADVRFTFQSPRVPMPRCRFFTYYVEPLAMLLDHFSTYLPRSPPLTLQAKPISKRILHSLAKLPAHPIRHYSLLIPLLPVLDLHFAVRVYRPCHDAPAARRHRRPRGTSMTLGSSHFPNSSTRSGTTSKPKR